MKENLITRIRHKREARHEVRRLERLHKMVREHKELLGASFVQYLAGANGEKLVSFHAEDGSLLGVVSELELWLGLGY
jgi:hypothetical protein